MKALRQSRVEIGHNDRWQRFFKRWIQAANLRLEVGLCYFLIPLVLAAASFLKKCLLFDGETDNVIDDVERGVDRTLGISPLTVIAATAWPFPAFEERAQAAENDGLEAQIIPSLTRWFLPGDLAHNDWPTRYARNCVRAASAEEWAAAWRVLATLALEERLDALEPPVSIIAGEVDRSTPPELMRRLAADTVVIPDAPHMIALTHPAELAQAILAG